MSPRGYPEQGRWLVVSVDNGEKRSEHRATRAGAMRTMLRHLEKGRPAWLSYDPYYFDDDDIPF